MANKKKLLCLVIFVVIGLLIAAIAFFSNKNNDSSVVNKDSKTTVQEKKENQEKISDDTIESTAPVNNNSTPIPKESSSEYSNTTISPSTAPDVNANSTENENSIPNDSSDNKDTDSTDKVNTTSSTQLETTDTQQPYYGDLSKILEEKLYDQSSGVKVGVATLSKDNSDLKIYPTIPDYKNNNYKSEYEEGIWVDKKHKDIEDSQIPSEKAELLLDYFIQEGCISEKCDFNSLELTKESDSNNADVSYYVGVIDLGFDFYFSFNSPKEESLLINALSTSLIKTVGVDGIRIMINGEPYSSLYGNDFSGINFGMTE